MLLSQTFFPEYLMATLLAVFFGDMIIRPLVSRARNHVDEYIKREQHFPEQSRWLGMVERALYVLSWYAGQVLFIGLWLTLKVAVQWSSWKIPDDPKIPLDENGRTAQRARARFLIFLWGSGLSILISAWSVILAAALFNQTQ